MPSQASSSRATTLSRNIKAARALRGLTQRQLAQKLDVEPMQVSKWERGWHRPSEENLHALAGALNTTVAALYAEPRSRKAAA